MCPHPGSATLRRLPIANRHKDTPSLRKIALLFAATLGLTMLSMGAANAGVHTTSDPDDKHAWVTTKGELRQIKKGMSEAKVNRILDGKGHPWGINPRQDREYGGQRNGMVHASAVISYDKHRRVKYKSWLSTESFYKGDVTVMFFHVEPRKPVLRQAASSSPLPTWAIAAWATRSPTERAAEAGPATSGPGNSARSPATSCATWPSKT